MMELSFEQALARLEEIVAQMDRGDMPLDKAIALFEEGTGLVRRCSGLLKDAEQTVVKLGRNSEGAVGELPFGEGEDGASEKT